MTNIVQYSDKEKWVHSGDGISFDGAGTQNFGNDYAKNVVIVAVNNSSSSHTDNCKIICYC